MNSFPWNTLLRNSGKEGGGYSVWVRGFQLFLAPARAGPGHGSELLHKVLEVAVSGFIWDPVNMEGCWELRTQFTSGGKFSARHVTQAAIFSHPAGRHLPGRQRHLLSHPRLRQAELLPGH